MNIPAATTYGGRGIAVSGVAVPATCWTVTTSTHRCWLGLKQEKTRYDEGNKKTKKQKKKSENMKI